MSWQRWLVTIVSFGASIGVSIFVVVSNWTEGAPLALPPVAHVLALCGALGEIGFRAVKMHLSASALRIPLDLPTSLRTCLAGDFGSAITPGRSGGEPARFLVLSEAGVPATRAVVLLYSELLLEMLTLAILALSFAAIFSEEGRAVAAVAGVVGAYAITVLGFGIFGLLLARRNASGPPPQWARYAGLDAGRWRTVQRALRKVRSGVAVVHDVRWRVAGLALFTSVLHVLSRLAILPALVLFVDPGAPIAQLILWPLALVYGATISPAPGGGGVVEVGFTAALGGAISDSALGAALIWWRFYTFYLYILLGALAAGRTVMRALRSSEREDEARRKSLDHGANA
ncbi:MAG: lysylphosphatidylglycerol synthase transmembrane domain-containing protein [Gemmatimonadaceae bacterium]